MESPQNLACENEGVSSAFRFWIWSVVGALVVLVLAAQSAPQGQAQAQAEGQVQAGSVLFRDKGCAYCHGMDLAGTKKAPALANIQNDKQWTAEKITDHILNGGQKMPPFSESLSDEEVAQLVAFLRAQKRPPVPAGEAPSPAGSPSN